MEITSYEYTGEFLKQFPRLQQSLVGNQFCSAVRSGEQTLDGVIEWVKRDVSNRLRALLQCGDNSERFDTQRLLGDVLETHEAYNFAEFIIAREALSPEEKERLKKARSDANKQAYMAKQPPSKKQLVYLSDLGHPTDQMPSDRASASQLIDTYLQQSKERRKPAMERQ